MFFMHGALFQRYTFTELKARAMPEKFLQRSRLLTFGSKHLSRRHGQDFTFGKRPPLSFSERNAGDQQHILETGRDEHTACANGFSRIRTPARQQKKTGRRGAAGRLYASMTVRKQGVAIRVEKIGGPQLAQIKSKLRYDRKAFID